MRPPVPHLLAITPPRRAALDAWIAASPALVRAGVDGVLLRVLDGRPAPAQVAALAALGPVLLVHRRCGEGPHLHLSAAEDPAAWRPRVPGLLGLSCHDRADLDRAAEAGCDYALLAPVRAPGSKPGDGRPPLGLAGLAALCATARLPVLALGGLGPADLPACRAAGAWGLAGISAFAGPVPRPTPG